MSGEYLDVTYVDLIVTWSRIVYTRGDCGLLSLVLFP